MISRDIIARLESDEFKWDFILGARMRRQNEVKEEACFDGKWMLRTNTSIDTAEVALKYKQLWMVEDLFRSIKSILETRPIYHKQDETIRGHVFCSFLSLILRKELQDRLIARGYDIEWADVIGDLDNLEEMEFQQGEKRFLLRSESRGCCGKVFQAAKVALSPTVRYVSGKDAEVQWEECVVPRGS